MKKIRFSFSIFLWLNLIFLPHILAQKPEYPLYAPFFGADHKFTDEDLRRIAENFDFVYGQELTTDEMTRARKFDPSIKFIKYIGNWKFPAKMAEKFLRRDIYYYQIAELAEDVDEKQTTFKLKTVPAQMPLTLKPSNTKGKYSKNSGEYVTWLRLSDEFVRIENFDAEKNVVTVSRGFDDSKAFRYKSGERIFSPAYGIAPNGSSEWESGRSLTYHYDSTSNARWQDLTDGLLRFTEKGGDGIWIDILMDKSLREADHNGVELKMLSKTETQNWNFAAGRNYTRDELREANERGVKFIQESFKRKRGEYPIIYGNNMMASRYENGDGGHKNYLLSTNAKPRPVDGMCIEDWAGGYDNNDWLKWRDKREVSIPQKACYPCDAGYKNWRENMLELMKASQADLNAIPLIINAGMKTAIFEAIPRPERHEWELWAYASYLLAVEKKNGKISTKLGIPMFYIENGRRFVDLDSMYFWRIGEPVETFTPKDFDKYKLKNSEVFQRRFTNGLVLVNPTDSAQTVKFEKNYFNPETEQKTRQIEMPPKSGKVLLIKK